MLERLRRAWRIFIASPSEPMTTESFKATFVKLYQSDPETRDVFTRAGITIDMLKRPDLDLKEFLRNHNLATACLNAMNTEEGKELLAKAATLAPDSYEMVEVMDQVVTRFGSPHIKSLLGSMSP